MSSRLYAYWLVTAVPRLLREAQSSLRSHNGGATAPTLGGGPVSGGRPSYACHRVDSPPRRGWRKYTSSIVVVVRLAHTASYMLARSRRPFHAVSEQHSRRCGVKTAG